MLCHREQLIMGEEIGLSVDMFGSRDKRIRESRTDYQEPSDLEQLQKPILPVLVFFS